VTFATPAMAQSNTGGQGTSPSGAVPTTALHGENKTGLKIPLEFFAFRACNHPRFDGFAMHDWREICRGGCRRMHMRTLPVFFAPLLIGATFVLNSFFPLLNGPPPQQHVALMQVLKNVLR
jgi:hypothetical protein